jgi:hypothetical protein
MTRCERPRDLLLHPLALLAIAVLVANDHWWKAAYGGWWTGKLSDAAGLTFFPLLLAAAVDAVTRRRLDPRALVRAAALVTAVVFAAVKTLPVATLAFRWAIGALQHPLAPSPVEAICDPTDLLALPFAAISVALTRRVASAITGHPASHPA